MPIETLNDIVEQLADECQVYGAHDEQHCYPDDVCRVCWTSALQLRLKHAFEVEQKLYPRQNQEDEHFAEALRRHWLSNIECDHEGHTDRAICACGIWISYPQPNIGEAVERWIEDVYRCAVIVRAAKLPTSNSDGG